MGRAAATEFPYTLCFGPLRATGLHPGPGACGLPQLRDPGMYINRPVVSPSYTLHAYVENGLGEHQARTLCGKYIEPPTWQYRLSLLTKAECAACQQAQGRWYGTHA